MLEINGRKIIVSSDDFGVSRKASANILELVQKNLIDRVEVMMSENITPDYIQVLLASSAKIDIHLHLEKNNLDRWQDGSREIENSILKRAFSFFYNYLFGKGMPRKVEKEWERQIFGFKELFGRIPDGASSHEHIHFFNPYFKIMLKLCRKHGINYIRLGGEPGQIFGSQISKILDFLKKKNAILLHENKIGTSNYMISFDWLPPDFTRAISIYPEGEGIEVVFHPENKEEYEFLASQARTLN